MLLGSEEGILSQRKTKGETREREERLCVCVIGCLFFEKWPAEA